MEKPLDDFEDSLASLVPRADRLDPAWREFLAKEAALAREEKTATGSEQASVCPCCGNPLSPSTVLHRWAWPSAFSAMTAVAGVLAIMLIDRPVSVPKEIVARTVQSEHDRTTPRPTAISQATRYADAKEPLRRHSPELPYFQLLDSLLNDRGMDQSASLSSGNASSDLQLASAPLSNRQWLNQLLREAAPDVALSRSNPMPAAHPGTKL